MRIALLGFNIFAPGGTTRSNLNLIHDFSEAGHQVTYINYLPFSNRQLNQLKRQESGIDVADYQRFRHVKHLDADVLMITRESFLSIVPWLRNRYPDMKIIAEIHTPLAMLNMAQLTPLLRLCHGVRVATLSIQQTLRTKWGIGNTYVQTVSLSHLNRIQFDVVPKIHEKQIKLYMVGRYDEQKDIPYAITLVSKVIQAMPEYHFQLTIIGYGPLETELQTQIDTLGLQHIIKLVSDADRRGICLSTAHVETLGYAIAEAFAAGNPVAAYVGDDGVVQENYQDFSNCLWLTKKIDEDSTHFAQWLLAKEDPHGAQKNIELLKQMEDKYVSIFTEHLQQLLAPPSVTEDVVYHSVARSMEYMTYHGRLNFRHRVVYAIKAIPGIRELM